MRNHELDNGNRYMKLAVHYEFDTECRIFPSWVLLGQSRGDMALYDEAQALAKFSVPHRRA